MRKRTSDTLQSSGASSATRLGTKVHQQKFITLEEVAYEASRLLSHSAPNIIGEIRAFTDLDVKDLNGSTASLRNPYYKPSTTSYRVEGKGSKVTRTAYAKSLCGLSELIGADGLHLKLDVQHQHPQQQRKLLPFGIDVTSSYPCQSR